MNIGETVKIIKMDNSRPRSFHFFRPNFVAHSRRATCLKTWILNTRIDRNLKSASKFLFPQNFERIYSFSDFDLINGPFYKAVLVS